MSRQSNGPRIPGALLEAEEERGLIRRIRAKWNAPLVNYFGPRANRPPALWKQLSDGARQSDRAALRELPIPSDEELLLYVEDPYPGHLYRARFGDVLQYLLDVPEHGFRSPNYLIPPDLSWLVAHTDEEIVSGHLILYDGPVPTPKIDRGV